MSIYDKKKLRLANKMATTVPYTLHKVFSHSEGMWIIHLKSVDSGSDLLFTFLLL